MGKPPVTPTIDFFAERILSTLTLNIKNGKQLFFITLANERNIMKIGINNTNINASLSTQKNA
jgi:hypothetical protein